MKLIEFTRGVIGKPYALGVSDCFSLITQYLAFRDVTVPENLVFQGHRIRDYAKDYKDNPVKMMQVAVDYIASITEEILPHKRVAGDVLLVRFEDSDSMVVDGGNGVVIAATEERGTIVLNQHDYEVLRVFRCQQNLS